MFTTNFQGKRTALEQITKHEASMIDAERKSRIMRKKSFDDADFKKELRDLEEWFDYLEDRRRAEHSKGLGDVKFGSTPPAAKPFPRTFSMLGDQAAGEDFCDEIAALMFKIALVVAVQCSIGVMIGTYESDLRLMLKIARIKQAKEQELNSSAGGASSAAVVAPPKMKP